MRILHTEASPGWGGQEIRILKEAIEFRRRGHEVFFAIQEGGGLVAPARKAGFAVFEVPFSKKTAIKAAFDLFSIIKKNGVEILNTHSSLDAWIGGIVAKFMGCKVIRTRHLSTKVRTGLNSYLLYKLLADCVVTTCEETALVLQRQANLNPKKCRSIPTGVDPTEIMVDPDAILRFRKEHGIGADDVVAGTLCVMRGWKGISDLLHAAKELENLPHLKWLVIGGGVSLEHFLAERKALGLEEKVIFTGHLSSPFVALASLDIFLLLSWAHEGVSQASLQAAFLEKPLITTNIGGLPEVCLDGKTGLIVPSNSPKKVATSVKFLVENPELAKAMGKEAKKLVLEKFTLDMTMSEMEKIALELSMPPA